MAFKETFHIKNFLVPPSTNLSMFLLANNQLEILNGANISYKLGEVRKDLGYQQIGSTLESGKDILGLHNFRQSSSTQKTLATCNDSTDDDTQLFYSTGGAWTEVTAAETAWANKADIITDMETFIGHCFIVGWGSTDGFITPASFTNTTFSTSANVTNMPSAKYIQRYRDRLYIANCDISATAYPYRVYYSSVPSSSSISWTVATDFFDVDYGEEIKGLGSNWDRLVIFTEYSAYLYNQVELKQVWDVGCSDNRTIANLDSMMIWANRDNVWASTGGRPEPIGNDILDLLKNSTSTNWRAAVVDREYYFYVGATSANGLSYSNCLLVYNARTNSWRWRELFDNVTALARYYKSSATDDYLWMGMDDGEVMEKGKYTDATLITSDDGNEISSHIRTKPFDFGNPSIRKKITRLVTYSLKGQNANVGFRVFNRNQEALGPFRSLGELRNVIDSFGREVIDGHFIQFELKEISQLEPWIFYGFSFLVEADEKLR